MKENDENVRPETVSCLQPALCLIPLWRHTIGKRVFTVELPFVNQWHWVQTDVKRHIIYCYIAKRQKKNLWWMENLPKSCLEPLLTFSWRKWAHGWFSEMTSGSLRAHLLLNGQRCLDSKDDANAEQHIQPSHSVRGFFDSWKWTRVSVFSNQFSKFSRGGSNAANLSYYYEIGFHANLYWPLP